MSSLKLWKVRSTFALRCVSTKSRTAIVSGSAYDYYAYGDDCWWLRRQALETGSPYWWSRYNACVSYY